jgi:hypothetical protein
MGGCAICSIVCDGAGSAELGGQGASIVCRSISTSLRVHFTQSAELPSDRDIWAWIDVARDRVGKAATDRKMLRRAFASTLVALVALPEEAISIHIGDGAIVGRASDESWRVLSPPENGEYASTTSFITDDPYPNLRIVRHSGVFSGFAVFSDGIEVLGLLQQTNQPHVPFFKTMTAPLDRNKSNGRLVGLSNALASFLREARVCEKTDDDKTLVLIVRDEQA